VLAPTRELAVQIRDSFHKYGSRLQLATTVVFGGVNQDRQVRDLERGVDVVVATPGRLLDLLGQKRLRLDKIEILVLDEADRMLDMGFINDIRKVVRAVPEQRQTLLFSATMPTEIAKLADSLLQNPLRVSVTPPATTVARIDESVVYVEQAEKRACLTALLASRKVERALVFARTKHGANKVVKQLGEDGLQAEALHGNKSQAARQRALDNFRTGATRVLVATDIAARGIDVTAISHVVNYDLPDDAESYVHRIGRTARAGARGLAVTFCGSHERANLRNVERLIGRTVPLGDVAEYGLPPERQAVPAFPGEIRRQPRGAAQSSKPSFGARGDGRQREAGRPALGPRSGERQAPRRDGSGAASANGRQTDPGGRGTRSAEPAPFQGGRRRGGRRAPTGVRG
jgi:ATP-dependent RNA helicase RhlE